MTEEQAVCCGKFVGWCAYNIGPMINAGIKIDEVANQCIQETYPLGDNPVDESFIKKYILASLS